MFCRLSQRATAAWLVCASLLSPLAAAGNRPGEPAGVFRLRRWTTEDGLPKNTVTSLLQTHDGYLWMGTRHGLARFDGVRFKVFTDELAIEEGGDLSCYDLGEDTVGRVWVRLPAGFVCYHQGRFQKFPTWLGATPSRQGGLWVVTREGVNRFEDGRYTPMYQAAGGQAREFIGGLREDREGRVWIGAGPPERFTWQRLDPHNRTVETLAEVVGESIADARDLHSDAGGRLWLGTPGELLCWEEGVLRRWPSGGAWRRDFGTGQLTIAGRDTLWFAPPFTGKLVRFQRGHFESFGVEDGLADTDFRTLLWDREGNLWVGMGVGGLQQLRPRSLTSLLTTNAVGARQPIDSVCSGRDGAVWLGAWGGLLRWQDGTLRRLTNSVPWEAVPGEARFELNAHPVLEDRFGQLWFGARDRGLFTLVSNQVARVPAADDDRTNWTVRVLHEDRAGRLWVGSESGLSEKQADHFVRYTTRDGLIGDNILGVRDAPDGSLWVGTTKGLHRFRDGHFRALTTRDGLLHNQANPLLVEQDGTAWVDTPLGLNRIRGDEIRAVTERQGLHDNALFCLLDDGAGHYWANSVRGIFRLRKTDLHAVADGRQERLFCVSYGEADGAASAEGSGDYQPNACRTPDGRLWFPTTRGVVVLDPAALVEREIPPPVVIEEVLAEDQLVFADGGRTALGSQMRETVSGLRLPAGRADVLEIRYTANSFVAPEQVQFRYRLEGADAQWREAGTRRVAFYTNLRPRSYRFQVEASNREGIWSEQPAVFAFSIAPHFWETWAFYGLCGAAATALAAAVQAYRLRWQRRLLKLEHQQAMADERTRIARDLHDDLGTALTGLALELDVIRRQTERAPPVSQRLGATAQRTRALAEQMREVVWTVNPRCDTVPSLASFLEQQAGQFLHAAGVQVRLEFPEDIPALPLNAEARHQLALGVREALTNVVRHAQATAVVVSLAIDGPRLVVQVADNGRGFRPVAEDGHGLANLRARLERIGGSFDCVSTPGVGTTIRFRVPLAKQQMSRMVQ